MGVRISRIPNDYIGKPWKLSMAGTDTRQIARVSK